MSADLPHRRQLPATPRRPLAVCARLWAIAVAATMLAGPLQSQEPKLTLPLADGSLRFAVIGDSGTGGAQQRQIAERMVEYRTRFPFELVLMLGDNIYGSEEPRDYYTKFERPYKPLLDAGVRFYASLGNHDERSQRLYKPFNMDGRFYYSFSPARGVRFFALDSTYPDAAQFRWVEQELSSSNDPWKICFFHHPLYSSGARHGSDLPLREALEPIFVKYGVSVVFAGHEHFYERIRPQKGITYFVNGAAAKLRKGNIRESALTARGFDADHSFMLVEIAGDQMHFQTIARTSQTVDSGIVSRVGTDTTAGR